MNRRMSGGWTCTTTPSVDRSDWYRTPSPTSSIWRGNSLTTGSPTLCRAVDGRRNYRRSPPAKTPDHGVGDRRCTRARWHLRLDDSVDLGRDWRLAAFPQLPPTRFHRGDRDSRHHPYGCCDRDRLPAGPGVGPGGQGRPRSSQLTARPETPRPVN